MEPNDGALPNAEAEAEGEPKGFETPNPEFPAGIDEEPKPNPEDNTLVFCELNVPPENPPEDGEPNADCENGPVLRELLNTSSPDFPPNKDDSRVVAGTANPCATINGFSLFVCEGPGPPKPNPAKPKPKAFSDGVDAV